MDPDLPVFNVKTFDELRAEPLAERRFAMMTLAFAGLAFMLSAMGVYRSRAMRSFPRVDGDSVAGL